MTETPFETVGGDAADGTTLPSARDAAARDLFVALSKALRAFQLYDERNPVYQRFVQGLREAFTRLWKNEGELTVAVEETRILLDGVQIYSQDARSESLAFLFYKDGVREVSFFPGIEGEELPRLLSVLHRVRYVGPESDDVLTMLWEEGLQHFSYRYIDYLAEGVSLPEPGAGAEPEQIEQARDEELNASEQTTDTTSPYQMVNLDNFNPTLYALDPRELELLDREVQLEMTRNTRAEVLNALFDRIEEKYNVQRQSEILSLLRMLLPNLLGRGAIETASKVLRELRTLESRPDLFDAERRQQLQNLLDEVSASEVLDELVKALEERSIAPAPGTLAEFLSHLRPHALARLLRASETVAVRELQPILRDAVKGIAERNRTLLVQLVSSPDPLIAAGAARLAGTLQIGEAASAVQQLLQRPEAEARLAAVEAAATLKASTVAGALQDVLTDAERDVRIAAARALGRLRYRPAAARFKALLTAKEMREADITEKIAFFEGYAELGDPDSVSVLDKLLNGKGLLGGREPSEVRAAAALGLGKVRTADAKKALDSAANDQDPVVRSAVSRAIRGRERER